MAVSTLWWLLAGTAVAIELLTGTFYLLMVALGMVAGALAAHLGMPVSLQIVAAALLGTAGVAALYVKRQREPRAPHAGANRDVNLDVGETVQVEVWAPDNTAVVRYRGASWTVVPAGEAPQGPGAYRVREVTGNRLVVEKI
ncbi:MAG TPA: NfeD family protein [Ramlibacter sp.]|nr:NfeD family protein [Ramlibacter sp.]